MPFMRKVAAGVSAGLVAATRFVPVDAYKIKVC